MEANLVRDKLGDDSLLVREGGEGEDPPAVVLLVRHEGSGRRKQRLGNRKDAGKQRCAEKFGARKCCRLIEIARARLAAGRPGFQGGWRVIELHVDMEL